LREIFGEVSAYLLENWILSFCVSFVAGLAAAKTVASERRSGAVFFLLVGVLGFFLGEFMLFYFGLRDYLESVAEFRILFDLVAAYVGAFVIAAAIHFIKPT